jgi:hypothetical protein
LKRATDMPALSSSSSFSTVLDTGPRVHTTCAMMLPVRKRGPTCIRRLCVSRALTALAQCLLRNVNRPLAGYKPSSAQAEQCWVTGDALYTLDRRRLVSAMRRHSVRLATFPTQTPDGALGSLWLAMASTTHARCCGGRYVQSVTLCGPLLAPFAQRGKQT